MSNSDSQTGQETRQNLSGNDWELHVPGEPYSTSPTRKDLDEVMDLVSRGVCKLWMYEKGYGFLVDDNGDDVFCHITSVPNNVPRTKGYNGLRNGDIVWFTCGEDDKGKHVINIIKVLRPKQQYEEVEEMV